MGRWKSALFYLFIVPLCLISSARVRRWLCHTFHFWPSLLKKVSLVAIQTVGCMFHHFAFKSKARTVSCSVYNALNFGGEYIIIICMNTFFVAFEKLYYPRFSLNLTHIRYNVSEFNETTFRNCSKLLNNSFFCRYIMKQSLMLVCYMSRLFTFIKSKRMGGEKHVKSPWVYSFVLGVSQMQHLPLVNLLTCRRKFRYSRADMKAARLHPPHQRSVQQHFSSKATSKLQTPIWMPSSRLEERSSGARVWRNSPGLRGDTEVRKVEDRPIKRRV